MARERQSEGQTALMVVGRLEEIASTHSLKVIETKGRFEQALVLAEGIVQLRDAVLPHIGAFMPLMDSPLGFLTDRKGKEPYTPQIICECLIEAVLRGVYPVGNEFNIIAGRCYITKNGFRRLVKELPGMADLRLIPGVPKMVNGGVVVPYKATWKVDGKPDSLERDIPIKKDDRTTVDNLLGKAERKALAAVYGQATGSDHTGLMDGEVGDPGDLLPGVSATERLASRIGGESRPKPLAQLHAAMEEHAIETDVFSARCDELGYDPAALTDEQAAHLLLWVKGVAERSHANGAALTQ